VNRFYLHLVDFDIRRCYIICHMLQWFYDKAEGILITSLIGLIMSLIIEYQILPRQTAENIVKIINTLNLATDILKIASIALLIPSFVLSITKRIYR
jgi:hypothetical protein